MPLAVNERSDEIKDLAEEWPLLEALMGGTPKMRAAATHLLPRWPNEEEDSYKARLATATLMPAYKRTVGVMASKPFSNELGMSDATPASITTWAEDIDLQGVSLHQFAAEMFLETLAFGLAGVLVEYPDTRPRDATGKVTQRKKPLTVAQVEASGVRPYFVRVHHQQILGWRAKLVGGRMRLTQLRILECREDDDGLFGTKVVQVVRVLEPGSWQTWEKVTLNGVQTWIMTDAGVTTLPYVPFVPFYGARDGFMCGRPPLLDLAYLNVKHWQSQSDQDTILHVARVPILAIIGADDKTQLTVGAMAAINLPDSADMKYIEHSGAAIGAGEASLAALQEQMIETGAELLIKRPGKRTATESANDAEANLSELQRIAEGFEDSLDQALQMLADYARLPSGGNVMLFKDYGAATLSDASATLVKDLALAGLISHETALTELKRRGVLAMEVDAATEADAVAAQGPALGTVPPAPADATAAA